MFGFSAERPLPKWRSDVFKPAAQMEGSSTGREVILFADTFNRYFEPDNLRAATAVLSAAGYSIRHAEPLSGSRPLCCGRTFLSVGLVEKARAEMQRTVEALAPYIEKGTPVIGLEPSCLLTFRDELQAVLPGETSRKLAAQARLFEEFIAEEAEQGHFNAVFERVEREALLHGHCHQKAFAAMGPVEKVLGLVPGLKVRPVESSCCGMAGSFGYKAETVGVSKAMAELSLLPAVRCASPEALVVADGFSCRHQIRDGAGREAIHVSRVLADALLVKSKTIA